MNLNLKVVFTLFLIAAAAGIVANLVALKIVAVQAQGTIDSLQNSKAGSLLGLIGKL
jgi:hypothetical protein